VDIVLETLVEVRVDEKLVSDDRFDDLTTRDVAGVRERTQIKFTEREDLSSTCASSPRRTGVSGWTSWSPLPARTGMAPAKTPQRHDSRS
jgi:hypothetical protein